MMVFSEYNQSTGLLTGRRYIGLPNGLLDMVSLSPESTYLLGEYDHLSQRVDLSTGNVVDYQPPQPGASYQWDSASRRWVYVANSAERLWTAKDDALREVYAFYSAKLSDVRATYPADEVASWGKQESEARAWTADHAAPTPLLSAIATARGVPFALLVEKVIEKADLFAAASGALIGARQQAEDRISAAATPADVAQIIADIFPAQ